MPGFASSLAAQALRRLGLVRARRVESLEQALQKAEKQTGQLKQALDGVREDARAWKQKFDRHKGDAGTGGAAEARALARLARLEERARKAAADLRQRNQQRRERVMQLREKVIAADRAVGIGREHLMAIEVKLDMIEGAINVLDRRFRTTPSSPVEGKPRT